MHNIGKSGGAMPRARPGDWDRALELATTFGMEPAAKQRLTELREAENAAQEAQARAEAAQTTAKERENTARVAEADAIRARQVLVDETKAATQRLSDRTVELDGQEKRLAELQKTLDAQTAAIGEADIQLRAAAVALDQWREGSGK